MTVRSILKRLRVSQRSGAAPAARPRQQVLAAAVAAAACVTGGVLAAAVPATAAGSTLRAAAEAQGKYFGTEVTGNMPATRRSRTWPASSSTWSPRATR